MLSAGARSKSNGTHTVRPSVSHVWCIWLTRIPNMAKAEEEVVLGCNEYGRMRSRVPILDVTALRANRSTRTSNPAKNKTSVRSTPSSVKKKSQKRGPDVLGTHDSINM